MEQLKHLRTNKFNSKKLIFVFSPVLIGLLLIATLGFTIDANAADQVNTQADQTYAQLADNVLFQPQILDQPNALLNENESIARKELSQSDSTNPTGISSFPENIISNTGFPSEWGDMDNDGDLDLVTMQNRDQLTILSNEGRNENGEIEFSILEQLPSDVERMEIALGDLDRDGDLDIVLVGYNNFQPPTIYQNPHIDMTGEMNNQWEIDSVSLSLTTTKPKNCGSSTTSYPEDASFDVSLGDLNGDGTLDVAIANYCRLNQVFLNQTVDASSPIAMSPALTDILNENGGTVDVEWVDIDNDKKLDLAFLDGGAYGATESVNGIRICLNRTENPNNPSFDECNTLIVNEPIGIFTAMTWGNININDHQHTALVLFGSTAGIVFTNDEENIFTNDEENITITLPSPDTVISNLVSPFDVDLGDVDNDGDLDVLLTQGGNAHNHIYQNNNGNISEEPVWTAGQPLTSYKGSFVDVDDDGALDVSFHEPGSSLIFSNVGRVFSNSPTNKIEGPDDSPTAFSLAWGDINNDGYPELMVGNVVMTLTGSTDRYNTALWKPYNNILYKNNNGTLEIDPNWPPTSAISTTTTSVAWGDIDKDGDIDLATGNLDGVIEIYTNTGGILSPIPDLLPQSANDRTMKVIWGDVNGDEWLDLAVANMGNDKLYINNGKGNIDLSSWDPDYYDSVDIAFGDIDGDSDLDLVVASINGNRISTYLNKQGNLENAPNQQIIYSAGTVVSSIALADTDQDGDLDMAVGGNLGAPVILYENVNGRWREEPIWQSDYRTDLAQIAFADMNADGLPDLVVAEHSFDEVHEPRNNTIYLNQNGQLNPAPNWISAEESNSGSLAIGDVNRDGKMDLAIGNGKIRKDSGYSIPSMNWFADYIEIYEGTNPASPLLDQGSALKIIEFSSANFYASSRILEGPVIPISYTLTHPDEIVFRLDW
ncbi:MAG: VCBS repeat-containing protein [Chloroflexota bacterium]